MSATNRAARLEVPPAAAPDRPQPQILRVERLRTRRRWTADKWLLVAMLACSCLFAFALATYVLRPAMDSVAGTSDETWSAGGP
jgi:hypothetical protein